WPEHLGRRQAAVVAARGAIVDHAVVQDEHLDAVESQPLQARRQRALDLAGEIRRRGIDVELGGDARAPVLGHFAQPGADHGLGRAVAVGGRGVDPVHAGSHRAIEHPLAFLDTGADDVAADPAAAVGECRNLEPSPAEASPLHGRLPDRWSWYGPQPRTCADIRPHPRAAAPAQALDAPAGSDHIAGDGPVSRSRAISRAGRRQGVTMDLMKMMKQAQEIQGRMQKMQEDLANLEVEGQSGAGLVKIAVNGKFEVRRLKIDPSLIKPEDAEMLEDLIIAAFQDAKSKAEAAAQAKMQEITGGLALPPGLKLF